MTAILGFNYLDGVLMMSDTEEALGGDAKSECDKLYRFIFPIGSRAATVMTGGAGDSYLIECANQEMHRFFTEGGLKTASIDPTPGEVLDGLNTFAGKFFQKVIAPSKGFSYEPGLEMLIAINILKKQSLLFVWKRNRVIFIPSPKHSSIGAGIVQIHPMLLDVQFSASKECMLFHGVRMMFYAKRAVVGVGGRTEAYAIQNDGSTHYFGTDPLQKIEDLVRNYEKFKINILDGDISTIAATDSRIAPELEANIESNLANLPATLRQYRQAYRDILEPQLEASRIKKRVSKQSTPRKSKDQQ